jgi:F-type H+-transporting ATPase subunit delta
MTSRAAAGRYARALFDVALKQADPKEIEQQLARFAELLREHPPLAQVLTNPAVPTPRKRALVQELVSRLQPMHAMVSKLLLLLAERDRVGLVPEILEAFLERLMAHLRIVRAEVVTAEPLSPERLGAIGEGLKRATGKEVTIASRVDPEIVGGLVARIGSVVYDGSIARQLDRMRHTLTEGSS